MFSYYRYRIRVSLARSADAWHACKLIVEVTHLEWMAGIASILFRRGARLAPALRRHCRPAGPRLPWPLATPTPAPPPVMVQTRSLGFFSCYLLLLLSFQG